MKLSVCIPCHINHADHLKNILSDLSIQTKKPHEIVIFLKPFLSSNLNFLHGQFDETELKIITSCEESTMGFAKNKCAEQSSGDILCFMDADDRIHPQKLEFVEKIFTSQTCDAMIHNYSMNNVSIFNKTLDNPLIGNCFDHVTGTGVDNDLDIPLHFAHCSVKKDVYLLNKFNENWDSYRADDAYFVKSLCKKGYSVKCVDLKLISFTK